MSKKFDFKAAMGDDDDDDQLNNALDSGLGSKGIDLGVVGGTHRRAAPQTTKMSSIISTGQDLSAYSTVKQNPQQSFSREEEDAAKQSQEAAKRLNELN